MGTSVGFVGLGKLGLPCAAAVSVKTDSTVYGFDVNPSVKDFVRTKRVPYQEDQANEFLEQGDLRVVETLGEVIENVDILFFAIQTPHERVYEGVTPVPDSTKDFEYGFLVSAVSAVATELRARPEKHITLVVISTVLPGTMRSLVLPIIEDLGPRVSFCYNPFFIAMGTTIRDFTNPEFVLVGEKSPGDSGALRELYSRIHAAPIVEMQIESAELTKVAYNTFIGFKIVFANTIAEIVDSRGGDADEVTNALSQASDRLISGKYLNAGMADGGGCHPRDQIAMSWLARDAKLSANVFDFLARARDAQTQRQADLIEFHHRVTTLPIVVLGRSYKANVNLEVGSPSLLLGEFLKEKGLVFSWYDPFFAEYSELPLSAGVFFIATDHDLFHQFEYPEGSIVIDPWGKFFVPEGCTLVRPGRQGRATHI